MVTDATRGISKPRKMAHVRNVSGIEKPLMKPMVKPYYRDGFGSKSIGEPQWRPHPRNAVSKPHTQENSLKGGNGLDWFSSVRCAPKEDFKRFSSKQQQPAPTQSKQNNFVPAREEAEKISVRVPPPVPAKQEVKPPDEERPVIKYDNYDDFEKIYLRRPLEISLRMSVGAKKKVLDKRNSIPATSDGDKSYQVPEYSLDFHKQGSTRPVVNFGGTLKTIPDTFVPLQDLPLKPRPTFQEKEKQILKRAEIMEVESLDIWKPADLLMPALQLPDAHG